MKRKNEIKIFYDQFPLGYPSSRGLRRRPGRGCRRSAQPETCRRPALWTSSRLVYAHTFFKLPYVYDHVHIC